MPWIEFLIIAVLSFALVVSIVGLYHKNTNAICKSKRRLDGLTAVVTGGTLGMGLENAIDFAGRGAKVIIACPFVEEGRNAEKLIKESTGNKKVFFKLLDLASLFSVRDFAKDILKNEDRLDILINNAGIGRAPKNKPTTEDGLNFLLQVNYFGHFLLTLLLLPLLKKTGKPNEKSRIVNVSSFLHNFAMIDTTNLNNTKVLQWLLGLDYANSKALLILFTRELASRLKDANVVINSLEPGGVGTTIFQPFGTCSYAVTMLFKNLGKNVWEGAQTAIYLAVDEKVGDVSGKHFKDCHIVRPSRPLIHDDKTAKAVWEESIRLVNLNEEEIKLANV